MLPFMAEETRPATTQPVITPEEGIARLQAMIERGTGLLQKTPTPEEMSAYQAALEGALMDAFGSPSRWSEQVLRAGITFLSPGSYAEMIREWHHELRAKNAVLSECIDELRRMATRVPPTAAPTVTNALATVENILRRFHTVAVQLRKRHEGRRTLVIKDEYDVQDLLHALLLVSFTDIRPEEYGPSHAGTRPRLDFLLKAEQIVIEVKKTRAGLTTAKLGEELLADIARYQKHTDCKTLVCFIYDPDGLVKNVNGFVRDIEETSSKMPVRVLVVPQH